MNPVTAVTAESIAGNEPLIRPYVRRTPEILMSGSDFGLDAFPLTLKLEFLQHSGSFKARGAFSNALRRTIPQAGVVAASGGNHGAAVAYVGMRLGVRAKIFVPSISSPAKIARIREYGADLVVGGERYADALVAAQAYSAQSGALSIHAFDSHETLLGTGTIGMELDEAGVQSDAVLAGVGGGGLIGGIAAWYAGRVRVIGVEPKGSPTLTRALEAGAPVDAPAEGLAADSLAPRQVGALIFPVLRENVHRCVLVDDDAIRTAQRTLWDVARIVAEPGGAAAFAALLSGRYAPARGERVTVIISGANTTAVDFTH